MGNTHLGPTHVEDLVILKPNSLKFSIEDEESYKQEVKAEKKKMKLISKHNEEEKDSQLIAKCLSKHFLLRLLEKPAVYEIVRQLSYYQINSNVEVFTQGQPTGYFYILSNGICEIITDDTVQQLIGAGTCFGELSLLYGCNREYTLKTKTECFVWAMEKKNFLKIAEHLISINFEENNKICSNYSIFNTMTQNQKNVIINKLYYGIYPGDRPIFNVNDTSYCLYFIKEGEVEIKYKDNTIGEYGPGSYFGLLSVINKSNRIVEAIPCGECKLYSISTSFLHSLCGQYYISEILLAIIKAAFLKYDIFKKINFKFLN